MAASDTRKLNVGGQVFEASVATFNKSLFLATFFGEDLSDPLDATPRFLDRDPELFTEVLRLLRGYPFKRHPRILWSEVKKEADFYQVPDLNDLAPPPPLVLPPEMPATTTIRLCRAPTKKTHWIPRSLCGPLPNDVRNKSYHLSICGAQALQAIDDSVLPKLGFVQHDDDTMDFTRKEKTVFYAKVDGLLPEVPVHPREMIRKTDEEWLSVTYWQ